MGALLTAAFVLGCGIPADRSPDPPPPPTGFVQRDGTALTRDGRPFRFTGLNVYNAASTGACGSAMVGEGLDRALSTIDEGSGGSATVVRAWFFQSLATRDGRRDWTALDQTLRAARDRGFLVVPTLGNHWPDCDGDRGPRPEEWYATGYRSAEPGSPASYRSWVAEVVERYRDDPTVAFWQLMNEAETSTGGRCPDSAAATLRAFAADLGSVVKAVDRNHLLSLGTIGTGQCGTSSQEYAQLHALGDLDLCEYHDYGADEEPMPGDEWNGLHRRLAQCAGLGKPLVVGEAGIPARLGLERRAELFRAKVGAQLAAGVAGHLIWTWQNPGTTGDEFAVGPGDPLLGVLGEAVADRPGGPASGGPGSVGPATPPMGFNHYNAFGTQASEATIREVADAMVGNGMRDAGYRFVNLDDGWQGARDGDGNLTANARFPGGIAALADHVHARGLQLGIYTSPAATSCGGYPGSAGHAERDARTFASWGVDFVKLDWCGADYSPTGARRIAEDWRAAIAATGRPMVLSINAGGDLSVPTWAARTTALWRTGDDICASWFNKTRAPSPAARNCWTRRHHNGIFDYLESTTEQHRPYVGAGHWADPDMLEVGNPGLTQDEARTHFGLWAMWSAPLLAGHDPRAMTAGDATSAILLNPEVIAVDQDPLGAMARTVAESGTERVLLKPLSGGRFALLAVNLSDGARDVTVNWGAVGVHDRFTVRDAWAGVDRGPLAAQFTAPQVPPHGSVLLILTPSG